MSGTCYLYYSVNVIIMKLFRILVAATLSSCFVPVNDGCPSLACGNECCPDSIHYGCNNNQCFLISCADGFQTCGEGCIPVTANCCDHYTGEYCQTGTICCSEGCIPIGTSCCGNGNYCPVGSVCCNNNTQCCN